MTSQTPKRQTHPATQTRTSFREVIPPNDTGMRSRIIRGITRRRANFIAGPYTHSFISGIYSSSLCLGQVFEDAATAAGLESLRERERNLYVISQSIGRDGSVFRCHALQEVLAQRPRMDFEKSPRMVTSNDPVPRKTITINPDDPHSMSQLLRLLEWQVDKHIDDRRYVSPISNGRNGLNYC